MKGDINECCTEFLYSHGTIRLKNLSKLEVEQTPLHVQSRRTTNAKFEMVTYTELWWNIGIHQREES